MIPAIFLPFAIRLSQTDALGAMGKHGVRQLVMHAQQVAQHVFMVVYIVVHRHDDGFGEVGERRHQFAIGAYVGVVVANLKNGAFGFELLQFGRNLAVGKLSEGEVENEFVGQHRPLQQRAQRTHGIRYSLRKRGHRHHHLRALCICDCHYFSISCFISGYFSKIAFSAIIFRSTPLL